MLQLKLITYGVFSNILINIKPFNTLYHLYTSIFSTYFSKQTRHACTMYNVQYTNTLYNVHVMILNHTLDIILNHTLVRLMIIL